MMSTETKGTNGKLRTGKADNVLDGTDTATVTVPQNSREQTLDALFLKAGKKMSVSGKLGNKSYSARYDAKPTALTTEAIIEAAGKNTAKTSVSLPNATGGKTSVTGEASGEASQAIVKAMLDIE